MEKTKFKIICIVGARPNFMKIAPVMAAFKNDAPQVNVLLVHTGQHYDENMKSQFFEQLGIPEPDIDLEVGSGSHAVQTAEVMKRFEPVVDEQQPDAIVVVGDVNSTISCALVAAKKMLPIIHIEAGLRSYDRKMPEEINRILTDQLSDRLYITEQSAQANLALEGIPSERVCFVGNVMIDTLKKNVKQAIAFSDTLKEHDVKATVTAKNYSLVTLHRPSNVDNKEILERLLTVINETSQIIPVIFPLHPRTRGKITEFKLDHLINSDNIHILPPLGYMQLVGLMDQAKMVMTDSGGIQEETTALGVPCITLRENTERPITVAQGTNTIVGVDANLILSTFNDIMDNGGKTGKQPELWDGHAAERIVADMVEWLTQNVRSPKK
ncbi:MAG: UDP-N-acetylglucosamine 2-epimerase (non-hydrolyzing) [Gammaproteobacteria bacterium]|nr:UDP-N-acetylglucosamine 2-epimerase (non-hydrolyzing) [Gammaproteobacteria bacterium]